MNTLSKLRYKRGDIARWMTHQAERLLFAGTMVVVWIGHSPVYRTGGFSLSKFIHVNWSRFEHTFFPDKNPSDPNN
jgi:hypothetical protein